jgi:septum formation protein
MRVVLASASPRRLELLKQIGLSFEVMPSNIAEEIPDFLSPEDAVKNLAHQKALDVARKVGGGCLVIGADTVVVKDAILGKPKDDAHALDMLRALQGGWHDVITGVALISTSNMTSITGYEKTRVKVRELTDEMIMTYIKTGEPADKAGAYGIQGIGALIVEGIEGCYFNVVGLPLHKLSLMLEDYGIRLL